VGLIGGGQVPRPGDVSRAHHGILLLDARPVCRRHVLEVLRQPFGRVSDTYNLASALNLNAFSALADWVIAPNVPGRAR
jgi:magnesium chelatase family protein